MRQPHDTATVNMWIITDNVITPNDPHPTAATLPGKEWLIGLSQVTVDREAIMPALPVTGGVNVSGPRVVKCGEGGEEALALLADTPATVEQQLCPEST